MTRTTEKSFRRDMQKCPCCGAPVEDMLMMFRIKKLGPEFREMVARYMDAIDPQNTNNA